MHETLQIIHGYFAIALLLTVMYSSIMWFWFSDNETQINNASFRFFLKLEMIVSGLLLILGIIVLVSDPAVFSKGWLHLKIMLGIIAVGFVHVSSIKTKKYLNSVMQPGDRKKINIFRVIAIGLIMTTYTLTEVSQAKENPKIQKEIQEKFKDAI
tara:strand:- start:350 stop:814 length:465 start_codon:yes stop_codon:yes gene_type:complete